MSSTDSVSQALVPVSIPSDSLGSNLQGPDSPQGNDDFFFSLSYCIGSLAGSVGA